MTDQISLQQIQSLYPSEWVNQSGDSIDHGDEAAQVVESLGDFLVSRSGKKITSELRRQLRNFYNGGNKQAGMTFVDVQGTYTCGVAPKSNEDVVARSKRVVGEEIYAQGLGYGTNETLKDIGFVANSDEDYPSRAESMIALELDSIGKKGPYDNGSPEAAIKTCDAILTSVSTIEQSDRQFDAVRLAYIQQRYDEYKGYVNSRFKIDFDSLIPYLQKKHIHNTFRGLPFLCAGNAPLKREHADMTLWMWRRVPGFKYSQDRVNQMLKSGATCDEFVIDVLKYVTYELKLKFSQWYSLEQSLLSGISRDQGSPFKFKMKDGQLKFADERGELKYRFVIPISAFVQMFLIACSIDLIDVAPKTAGRIGLQEPSINVQRMNDFIDEAARLENVLISTDYTSYDSTLPAWMMNDQAVVYALLYEDEIVKDAMSMVGVCISQKLVFMTTSADTAGKPYGNFKNWLMRNIKGDSSYANKRWLSQLTGKRNKSIRGKIDEANTKLDYVCRLFYIYQGWLISGVVFTNTIGSDCSQELARYLIPAAAVSLKLIPSFSYGAPAITSGDDTVASWPKQLYDSVGYHGVLDIIEKAADVFHVLIKKAKQLEVKYKGYPLVDFLQEAYVQVNDIGNQKPYKKFLRQAPSLPYKERFSKLYLILQWIIVWGKLDSALCEENIDFAARVMSYAGRFMQSQAKKLGYTPYIPSAMYNSRSKLYWNPQYAINESVFAGMEQLIGLVKTYKGQFLTEVTRYCLSKDSKLDPVALIKEIDSELETRAPHKVEMGRAILSNLANEFPDEVKVDERFEAKTGEGYVSLVPLFLSKFEEFSGVSVNALSLDEPLSKEDAVPSSGSDEPELKSQDNLDDD